MFIKTYLKLSLYVFVLAVCMGQIVWAGSHASPATSDTMQNIRINSDATTELQNEEMIVINPLDPDQVVAVWRDFRLGHREVGHGYSTDGGASWSDALFFSDVVNPDYSWESDPGLGIMSNGTFVAHTLCIDPLADNSDICVYLSTNGGQTWSLPAFVVGGDFGFEDKQWMGIDRSNSANSGNIYFAWTRFPDFDTPRIMFSKSEDTAQTWGPVVQLSDGINSVQWPTVTCDHNGKIYAAWVNYSPASIRMRTSTDGEVFLSEQTVVSTSHGSTTLNGGVLAFSYPAMEADVSDSSPYQGNVYIAYMTRPLGDEDIYFVKSTNAGSSWSTPLRINDDATGNGKDQFFPWISVNEDGVITAAFMDRRNSPSNFEYDFYITQSFDGGDSWMPNLRISNGSSSPAMAALSAGTAFDPQKQPMAASPTAGLLGEYLGVSSVDRYVNLIWTDTRLGNQDALGSRFLGFYPPFLSSPANQSNINDTTPLFQWTTAGFYDTASAFNLQIASDSNFAIIETTIIAIDTSFLQIQAAEALDLGVHFWRVKGFNSSGDSSLYSRSFKFTLYMEGDANGDGTITLADVIFLVNYLFKNGNPAPVPFISGDPNCDNQISLADVIQLVNLLFNKPGDWTPCSHS
ncbi:MAG: dockerin type I domain-containing protein [candidate division Zixibacteria bacterium]|nr:dockerin type I domain-containing protein [candidate division Zixibacteria bacterium]